MKTPKGFLSFKHWLFLAFLGMALLFAASTFIGIRTLDFLSQRSQETSANAIMLNAKMLELSNSSVDMERAARQYMLFNDQSMQPMYQDASAQTMSNYQQALQKIEEILNLFVAQTVVSSQQMQQWQTQLNHIQESISAASKNQADTLQKDLLKENFEELAALQHQTRCAVNTAINQRNLALQEDISKNRLWITHSMLGLIILALLMTLAFGSWLARPFKRIEAAIDQLGANEFTQSIQIVGPADVRRLGRRLDWLRLQLGEIDADKARFLRHTSHELKTPLAALREGIALLQEELTGTLNSNQKDVVQILQQNAITLQNQIEDLLKFNAAAFEARKLKRQSTNLLDLIEDQIEAQKLQWQASNLSVSVQGNAIIIEVDKEKMAAVISNLLSNAIHYSPDSGHILFQLNIQNDKIYIDIIDEGPGISEEDSKHIFEPFYKGKTPPKGSVRGTGIGLSIVKEYILAHGGKIVFLQDRKGAHFQVELPYEK